jgi:hypothetical protein
LLFLPSAASLGGFGAIVGAVDPAPVVARSVGAVAAGIVELATAGGVSEAMVGCEPW